jgi:hypothetical protein
MLTSPSSSSSDEDPSPNLTEPYLIVERELSRAEAAVGLLDARIKLVDAAMADLRLLAEKAGIKLSPPLAATPSAPGQFMCIPEFAAFMRLSERTVANLKKQMVEGKHYQRIGRRVLIDVEAATAFIRERTPSPNKASTIEQIAVDEVTSRRARAALKRERRTA